MRTAPNRNLWSNIHDLRAMQKGKAVYPELNLVEVCNRVLVVADEFLNMSISTPFEP